MPIAFDTAVDGSLVNPGTSLTWSHTHTGNNLLSLVSVFGDTQGGDVDGSKITGVTNNSVSMTELARVLPSGDRWLYLFYLLAPATGAHNIVVSASSSIVIAGQSASYTGVKQSGFPDNSTTNTANTALDITTSLATSANNCWTFLATKNSIGASAADTGSTLRISNANGMGIYDSNALITPAGSYSMKVNIGSLANWAAIMASFAPADTGPDLTHVSPQQYFRGMGSPMQN